MKTRTFQLGENGDLTRMLTLSLPVLSHMQKVKRLMETADVFIWLAVFSNF